MREFRIPPDPFFAQAVALHRDDPSITVRLVRRHDGSSYLIAIPNAHPWVLRRPHLVPADVD